MHPDTGRLLELRDGDGDADTAAHVAACAACAAELARLHAVRAGLRGLPPLAAPPAAWDRARARRKRRGAQWYFPALAVAATVVMAVALTSMSPQEAVLPPVATPAGGGHVAALAATSGDLDRLLATYEPEQRVLDLNTAGTIVALEDQIAAVDGRLQQATLTPDEAEALWRQRVQLMQALVGVHATTTNIEF